MTTLHDRDEQTPSMRLVPAHFGAAAEPADAAESEVDPYKLDFRRTGADRREHRRHDLEQRSISVSRWDDTAAAGETPARDPESFGRLVDLSASGARIRTAKAHAATAGRIRVRLELPAYAGISPFITTADGAAPRPTREWVGHLEVARVRPVAGRGDEVEVAGRLLDMTHADRGMLGLYLSTQPLAA